MDISCLVRVWFCLILFPIRITLVSVTIPLSIKFVHSWAEIVFMGFTSCARFFIYQILGMGAKKADLFGTGSFNLFCIDKVSVLLSVL